QLLATVLLVREAVLRQVFDVLHGATELFGELPRRQPGLLAAEVDEDDLPHDLGSRAILLPRARQPARERWILAHHLRAAGAGLDGDRLRHLLPRSHRIAHLLESE